VQKICLIHVPLLYRVYLLCCNLHFKPVRAGHLSLSQGLTLVSSADVVQRRGHHELKVDTNVALKKGPLARTKENL